MCKTYDLVILVAACLPSVGEIRAGYSLQQVTAKAFQGELH